MSSHLRDGRPDLRRHHRVLIHNARTIRVAAVPASHTPPSALQGVVTILGLGGMFIRTRSLHPLGTVLHLRLVDAIATFDSECTVRTVAPNGLGVEFTRITPENEMKLKALLSALKL
jgi:PilZ domain